MRASPVRQLVRPEISRFPCKERACMPGSPTTPGRPSACVDALGHVAFRYTDSVGTREQFSIAAQWLACTFPYRRFAGILTDACARLGADVVRYSFIAVDLHHLLLAGLPAHLCENAVSLHAGEKSTSQIGSGSTIAEAPMVSRPRKQAAGRVFTQPRCKPVFPCAPLPADKLYHLARQPRRRAGVQRRPMAIAHRNLGRKHRS